MTETPDQLTIDTPEQVAIRFPIAGIGSRFLALLADTVVQLIAYAFSSSSSLLSLPRRASPA